MTDRSSQLSVQPNALRQLDTLAPQALNAVTQALSSGKLLDVVISHHKKSGQRGFYLFGQFIPATVPESVRSGDRLNLKVSEVGESIILKIINAAEPFTEAAGSNQISELIPEEKIQSLRSMINTKGSHLDVANLKRLASSPSVPREISGPAAKILAFYERLSDQHELIQESSVHNVAQLEHALLNIGARALKPKDSKKKIEELNTLKTLFDEMRSALQNTPALSGDQALEKNLQTISEASASIVTLAKAVANQELIKGLNLITAELGQSSILIYPALLDKNLSYWGLEYNPREYANTPPNVATEAIDPELKRLHLLLDFSQLGTVRVDLAFSQETILAKFNFTNPDANKLMLSQVERLKKVMKSIGFASCEIICHQGDINDIAPVWLRKVTGISVRS